jgi:uncharacterized protein YjbI with pentapeptide repeats
MIRCRKHTSTPPAQDDRAGRGAKIVLGASAAALAISMSILFGLGVASAAAYALLGALLTTAIVFFLQFITDQIVTRQFRRLQLIRDSLGGVQVALGELADKASITQGTLDQLAQTASSAREDVLRLKLSGSEAIVGINAPETKLNGLVLAPGRDLSGANLQEIKWAGIEADEVIFKDARLEGALLSGTMNRSSFAVTFLQRSTLDGNFGSCNFHRAMFQSTRLRGYFRSSNFKATREFTEVYASGADLRDCHFGFVEYTRNSCFWAAILSDAKFQETCISACDFRWSVLRDATFTATEGLFTPNMFEGALLDRTNFRAMPIQILMQWDLAGAIDADALWPDGFHAHEAGVLPISSDAGRNKLLEHLAMRENVRACPDHGTSVPPSPS